MLYRDAASVVAVDAPAKLNLLLNVLGKRPDGYHELETLMVSVDRYDSLRLTNEPSGALTLACHDGRTGAGPGREKLPVGTDNLVLKAAALLRDRAAPGRGARVELVKRIPLAAGLAGGSSDAAATLVGLNRLWNAGLDVAELHSLAARLGSDVPFFLCTTAAALCRGRGELVQPLRLARRLHFVVARPRSGLSTAEVFRHCRPSASGPSGAELAALLERGDVGQAARRLFNALEEPALELNRDVSDLKKAFSRLPFAGHAMSGSGTACFGVCRSRRQALVLASRLKAARLGDVFVASSRP